MSVSKSNNGCDRIIRLRSFANSAINALSALLDAKRFFMPASSSASFGVFRAFSTNAKVFSARSINSSGVRSLILDIGSIVDTFGGGFLSLTLVLAFFGPLFLLSFCFFGAADNVETVARHNRHTIDTNMNRALFAGAILVLKKLCLVDFISCLATAIYRRKGQYV